MMSNLSSHMASKMIACGAINQEDRETYQYGIYVLLTSMIHIITVLFIGALFRMVLEGIVYYGSYAVLRKFAGGYHASTSIRCYLLSLIVVAGAMFAVGHTGNSYILLISSILLPLAAGIIFVLSPVENLNKPLEGSEAKHYKKTARIILTIELILAVSFLSLGFNRIIFIISLSLTTLAIMLLAGKKNISNMGVEIVKLSNIRTNRMNSMFILKTRNIYKAIHQKKKC